MPTTNQAFTSSVRAAQTSHAYSPNVRLSLNIPLLVELLRDYQQVQGSSKKRAASLPPETSSKRRKTKNGYSNEIYTFVDYPECPKYTHSWTTFRPNPESKPDYVHNLDIFFDRVGEVADGAAQTRGWIIEEKELDDALETLQPHNIDIGPVSVYGDTANHPQDGFRVWDSSQRYLCTLPEFIPDFDFDIGPTVSKDFFAHCRALITDSRIGIRATAAIIAGDETTDIPQFPFYLHLQFEAYILPSIALPFNKVVTQTNLIESRRIFLTWLALCDTAVEMPDEINIHHFYSILRPAPALEGGIPPHALQPLELGAKLLPFQRRSVAWLLKREGKGIDASRALVQCDGRSDLPPLWKQVTEELYFHQISGAASTERPSYELGLGGILAEEPGLGKTLETIGLIMLNPAPLDRNPSVKYWDESSDLEIKQIKTTLIVTPPALATQWIEEIARHAPTLKVLMYDGWAKVPVPITEADVKKARQELEKKSKSKAKSKKTQHVDPTELVDWCSYVQRYDVCITTYQTLRSDLHVARAAPKRPRREDVVYANVERSRSPLVMCEWYRVVMDEVQMVKGQRTEEMVSLVPRSSSFAVSGTPARAQVSDLLAVLKFLKVEDALGATKMWKRMLIPSYHAVFTEYFQHYAIRTTKASVKSELTIPQQTRYLVDIEMSPIERQVYDQQLEQALLELGLDARGVAAIEGWEVDGSLLRSTIRRLRGICTHPQVGQLQKQGDKAFKPGTLKSMEEVLEGMQEQNWKNLMDQWKLKVQSMSKLAQLLQQDRSRMNRHIQCLDILQGAAKDAEGLVEAVQAALVEHKAKGKRLKAEARGVAPDALEDSDDEVDVLMSKKGKGKQRQEDSVDGNDDDDAESADSGSSIPKTPALEAHQAKGTGLMQRLREVRLVLHRVYFLKGDVHHILGQTQAEEAAYEMAEQIRRKLLSATEQSAQVAMDILKVRAADKKISKQALQINTPVFTPEDSIIELANEADSIVEDVLNEQSKLLWQWRQRIEELLTSSLTGSDGEATGVEYQHNLDDQGEVETFLQAYAALLADRREALTSERTLLAAHDVREKKLRHTKAAMRAAAEADGVDLMNYDVEIHPEHAALQIELSHTRKQLVVDLHGRSVKSVLVDVTTAANKNLSKPEKDHILENAKKLRQLMTDQTKLMDILEADINKFRKAFNERVLYFRQLQEISDSVTDAVLEGTLEEAIQATTKEQNDTDGSMNALRARQRFLNTLTEGGNKDGDDEDVCILCRCDFSRGYVTQCAHVFCEMCMKEWMEKKGGKTCPVCRVPVTSDALQRFYVKEGDKPEAEKPTNANNGDKVVPKSRRQIAYNMIDPTTFTEVRGTHIAGSYSEKIQTMVQHLLYIQQTEPGAKSIIFSAWADSLHIIQHALSMNGIRSLRIDQNRQGKNAAKIFKDDPDILVLLLHGERENAGLNITVASRIFLVESVVNHGFEVQAIARIDRMGQTRPTEVYCYYAKDTVEQNILDLAARKGLSIYTKENSAGTVNVSSLDIDVDTKMEGQVKKGKSEANIKKGDSILRIDDMLAVLFPHMYEEVEYLLPPDAMDVDIDVTEPPPPVARFRGHQNAEAGPSRIPI